MRNIYKKKKKKLSKKLIILSFFHKMFLKIVPKPKPLMHLLTFQKKKIKKEKKKREFLKLLEQ